MLPSDLVANLSHMCGRCLYRTLKKYVQVHGQDGAVFVSTTRRPGNCHSMLCCAEPPRCRRSLASIDNASTCNMLLQGDAVSANVKPAELGPVSRSQVNTGDIYAMWTRDSAVQVSRVHPQQPSALPQRGLHAGQQLSQLFESL